MKVFSTTYMVGKTAYSSFIHAPDRKTAEHHVASRGIGETITGMIVADKKFDPCPLPSIFYTERKLLPCIHLLTFYGWIAGHFMNVHHEMLRDDGVLHEIMHEMEFPQDTGFRPLVLNRLQDLERLIPGLKTFDQRISRSRSDRSRFS